MKFIVASVLAFAAGAMAYPGNVTVVTEVVESYVTYCPSPTTITYGTNTITVTEPTTITITDCPCTVTKPVITTSSTICHDCPGNNSTMPTLPPSIPTTVPLPPPTTPTDAVPTGTPPPTGAAAKVGLSGLAGLAFIAALL
jgi:hypothetical protein